MSAPLKILRRRWGVRTWYRLQVNLARRVYLPFLTASYSTKEQGVAYSRTDMGGIYKLNVDDTWTPLTDWVDNANWGVRGADALALDPSDAKTLYLAAGGVTDFKAYRF